MTDGGCGLITRGAHLELTAPRLFHDEERREIRTVERRALGALQVYDFLELQLTLDTRATSGSTRYSQGVIHNVSSQWWPV
jgi:hypothetical protein